MNRTLAIVSGGMDSTVLAHYLSKTCHELCGCVSINYGQRHSKELDFAKKTAETLGVPHYLLDASFLRVPLGASVLTEYTRKVPEGHYAEDSMKETVVPNRNMILMSLAIGLGITMGANRVAYGAHSGDHAIYPDCRPEFANAMALAASLCDYRPMELLRPFIGLTKAEIVDLGFKLKVDFCDTWTCYNGGQIACGRCGTCVERLEAFALVGRIDPVCYSDREFYKTVVQGKESQSSLFGEHDVVEQAINEASLHLEP